MKVFRIVGRKPRLIIQRRRHFFFFVLWFTLGRWYTTGSSSMTDDEAYEEFEFATRHLAKQFIKERYNNYVIAKKTC